VKDTLAPGFLAEFDRLPTPHRALFLAAIRQINIAYAQRGDRTIPRWPARLRIKKMAGPDDLWEMTWSFAGPDGRATFEFITVDGELAIRWRRIGDHRIYENS
jgi:hypothetical protein